MTQVSFPCRVIASWIRPVQDEEKCDDCGKAAAEYYWTNYIEIMRRNGDTIIYNVSTVPWERAIKDQAQGIYKPVYGSRYVCRKCMIKSMSKDLAAEYSHISEIVSQKIPAGSALALFFVFNSYADEGVCYFIDTPDTDYIENVAATIAKLIVPAHEDKAQPEGAISDLMRDMKQKAERKGASIRFIPVDTDRRDGR
jgi:hypothetical protein